ncbi:MAG: GlmU family protein [Bacteroidota bacterium]|nr:GlmU family protein [Bacteroidota bacterium]MDP4232325.1 GlmU family protein [Bacteroidota bacterium]MDP4241464.1 GlmU family protein [Bacteroidota bacterium]MDP4286712.1 GlmU family protein [Bacteroidota bacterium]
MPLPFQNILIYEDELARSKRFLPLTYTRSVAELRSGAMTGIERMRRLYPEAAIYLHCRKELADVLRKRYGLPVNEVPKGESLLVNARAAVCADAVGESYLRANLTSELTQALLAGEPFDPYTGAPNAFTIGSIWELVLQNSVALVRDSKFLKSGWRRRVDANSLQDVATRNFDQLYLHPRATIGADVVLDCTDGPIMIEEGAHIMPHSTIIGPVYIGRNSIVKIGSKIYGGTTIGPVSKVGGEIENSIIQGYSNKQHDGYLGHSFLGEWVNLGAGTNTSDLKNDYSPVRVTIEGESFDTGSLFVGLLMGDHSKSAIGTQFNTGTAIGVSCNIFGSGFPPKWIPSFSWGGASEVTSYRYEKAIEVAKAVMARREIIMTAEDEAMLRQIFISRQQIDI